MINHSKRKKLKNRSEPRPKRPPTHNHREKKIVFGSFKKQDGKDVLVVNNAVYPVVEFNRGVPVPLALDTQVKALLKPTDKNSFEAIILKALGLKLSLKERVVRALDEYKVSPDFPAQVLHEANAYPEKVSPSQKKSRTDLTNLALCTIDGESAKDFDDAVFARQKGKNIEVIVAIADVSHYVKEHSALDQEAFRRGTSIYYPGHCVPMLPENLSNGLCSLKPQVLRLALAVSFELGPKGAIAKPTIFEAVIKSAARLTYNQVQSFYETNKADFTKDIKNSLMCLKNAAHILRKNRQRRGALDFDITESLVALDDRGEPIAIHPHDRLESHRIIEDLMVATNEVVAELFQKKKWPCVYRVHEPPEEEKLAQFFNSASAFGVLAPERGKRADINEPKDLQKIVSNYQKSRYQSILNTLMLRAMMQARYSEQNLMHFGLASKAYLHFTSPIRRYADLIVHRQLRYLLFDKNHQKKISEDSIKNIANSISDKETTAVELERKIDRLYSATFMANRVGETFKATIASVTEFGMFVRIIEHHVEGLVHISAIASSHVNYVPERMSLVVSGSNQKYMVGDEVMVKLVNVNIDRGFVDFELVRQTSDQRSKNKRPNTAPNQKRA